MSESSKPRVANCEIASPHPPIQYNERTPIYNHTAAVWSQGCFLTLILRRNSPPYRHPRSGSDKQIVPVRITAVVPHKPTRLLRRHNPQQTNKTRSCVERASSALAKCRGVSCLRAKGPRAIKTRANISTDITAHAVGKCTNPAPKSRCRQTAVYLCPQHQPAPTIVRTKQTPRSGVLFSLSLLPTLSSSSLLFATEGQG